MLALSVWLAIRDAVSTLAGGRFVRLDPPATPERVARRGRGRAGRDEARRSQRGFARRNSPPPSAPCSSIRRGSRARPGRRGPFLPEKRCSGRWRRRIAAADPDARLALIRAHPDLAGKAARAGALTEHSRGEQQGAGLDRLSDEEYERFHRLNAAYRERFGFPLYRCGPQPYKGQYSGGFRAPPRQRPGDRDRRGVAQYRGDRPVPAARPVAGLRRDDGNHPQRMDQPGPPVGPHHHRHRLDRLVLPVHVAGQPSGEARPAAQGGGGRALDDP